MDYERLLTDRVLGIDASGVRRAFDLAASLEDPINLSIGLPHFDVPEAVKAEAQAAIGRGVNRYTPTQGLAELRDRVMAELMTGYPETLVASGGGSRGWPDDTGLLITSGVSGGLMLLMLSVLQPRDEVLIPDPYFVMYKHLVTLSGATAVYVDTYPDFRLTAERVEPLITERTKLLILNSPGNPTGVVSTQGEIDALSALCAERGVLLCSDEIYDLFTFDEGELPSPLRTTRDAVVLRGFSKTYAMTGWRLGYAFGPRAVLDQMTKLQQYSFVCAPSTAQSAGVVALDADVSGYVAEYRARRDRVVERLSGLYEVTTPGGAFYAFPQVPEGLGMTGTHFTESLIERNVICIGGGVFSQRDTHFRISYACDEATLERGLEVLVSVARD
ncbi:MAG: aminotransferase class I/II-fold pyridoxal phosphate-dependent enzyme [Planctomycetota bacterium]